MAKMTRAELEKIIERTISKVIGPKLESMIEEKLEEFSDDIAATINEVVELKMKKTLKEFASKKTLRDKILEQAGGNNSDPATDTLNEDWSRLIEPSGSSKGTGITQDFLREAGAGRGGFPHTTQSPINESSVDTGIAADYLKDSQNQPQSPNRRSTRPLPVASADPMDIDQLANADYPDDLLGE